MNEINVYCDNQRLKEFILETRPSITGLFPHEIAMLEYTTYGKYSLKEKRFSGTFQYEFYVDYPELLFESLVDRGYIRLCQNEELVDCLKHAELCKVLKQKKIKIGKPTKENVKRLVNENFTSDELSEVCGNRYYVVSDLGKIELEANKLYTGDILSIWRYYKGDEEKDYLKEGDVIIINNNRCILDIKSLDYNGRVIMKPLNNEESLTRSYKKFANTVSLDIRYDDELIIRLEKVISIFLLKKKKLLIVNCELKNDKAKSIWIDFDKKEQIFYEKIPIVKFNNIGSNKFFELSKRGNNIEGVIDEKNIYYYIHVKDAIAEAVVMYYFANKIEVKKLPKIINNDTSDNYVIKVEKNDIETQRIIVYMMDRRYIVEPVINEISVHDIVFTMGKKSEYRTLQQVIENELLMNELKKITIDIIRKEISADVEVVIKKFLKVYPSRIIFQMYPYEYSFENNFKKSDNWLYVVNNREILEKEYKKIVKQLLEERVIPSRWKNEFELFYIIKKYFEDTIFQYSCEWLEKQSLDIFIPSRKTAIEYQGKQHYEAVEFFGGEEAFKVYKERDMRKKMKCEKHGVKVIYWHYKECVNEKNVFKMLSNNGLVNSYNQKN